MESFYLLLFYLSSYFCHIFLKNNNYSGGFKVFFLFYNLIVLLLISIFFLVLGSLIFEKILFAVSISVLLSQVLLLIVYKRQNNYE